MTQSCDGTVITQASSGDALTSEQRDDQLAVNSAAARNFIVDMDLSMINHEMYLSKVFIYLLRLT